MRLILLAVYRSIYIYIVRVKYDMKYIFSPNRFIGPFATTETIVFPFLYRLFVCVPDDNAFYIFTLTQLRFHCYETKLMSS